MNQSAAQTAPVTLPGLTSIRLAVPPAEEAEYKLFRDRLAVDIQPLNQLEYNLFNQLVAAQWQLMHIAAQESQVLTMVPDVYADAECWAMLERLLKHRQRLEVTQAKVLKELRALQTQRHNRGPEPVEPPPLAVVRRKPAPKPGPQLVSRQVRESSAPHTDSLPVQVDRKADSSAPGASGWGVQPLPQAA
jgi:hypothetical protein